MDEEERWSIKRIFFLLLFVCLYLVLSFSGALTLGYDPFYGKDTFGLIGLWPLFELFSILGLIYLPLKFTLFSIIDEAADLQSVIDSLSPLKYLVISILGLYGTVPFLLFSFIKHRRIKRGLIITLLLSAVAFTLFLIDQRHTPRWSNPCTGNSVYSDQDPYWINQCKRYVLETYKNCDGEILKDKWPFGSDRYIDQCMRDELYKDYLEAQLKWTRAMFTPIVAAVVGESFVPYTRPAPPALVPSATSTVSLDPTQIPYLSITIKDGFVDYLPNPKQLIVSTKATTIPDDGVISWQFLKKDGSNRLTRRAQTSETSELSVDPPYDWATVRMVLDYKGERMVISNTIVNPNPVSN